MPGRVAEVLDADRHLLSRARIRDLDVPLLFREVDRFLREAAERAGRDHPRQASDELIAAIVSRSWPGNLRELRNEMLRMDALADSDVLSPELLSPPPQEPTGKDLNLDRLEQWAIQEALKGAGGNKSEAARILGISRRALYNKLSR